jgi:hypothetical protein
LPDDDFENKDGCSDDDDDDDEDEDDDDEKPAWLVERPNCHHIV